MFILKIILTMRNVISLSLSLLALILVGCRSVERNEYDFFSTNRISEHIRIDSIVLHDSIFIREKSDTVFFTKYRTLYRERMVCDTVVRCDTVFVEREIEVEKKEYFPLLLFITVLLSFFLWRSGALRVLWKLLVKR